MVWKEESRRMSWEFEFLVVGWVGYCSGLLTLGVLEA